MKFDELIKMYLEEFDATPDTTQYMKKYKGYSTDGPNRNLKRKKPVTVPTGFKGDINSSDQVVVDKLFYKTKK